MNTKFNPELSVLMLIYTFGIFISCEEFVQLDPPRTEALTEEVFGTDATATQAIIGAYAELSDQGLSIFAGRLELASGLASDELANFSSQEEYFQYETNSLLPSSNWIFSHFWQGPYKVINSVNAAILGLEGNTQLSPELRDQLIGEAYFLRAFQHFYLTNFFGDVPLVTSTDFEVNTAASRDEKATIYEQIVTDLSQGVSLLSPDYSFSDNERIRVNRGAAQAMLARVYLYQEDWQNAADMATSVIEQADLYALEDDLSEVFLAGAGNAEAIWQLASVGIFERPGTTYLGDILITLPSGPINGLFGAFALSEQLLAVFEPNDQRGAQWVDVAGSFSFANKLKNGLYNFNPGPAENVMMLRLAEQYLIRSEARAQLNDVAGAREDLNKIRNRAGLEDTEASDQAALLAAIQRERQVELFAENGHRWFDLKRTGRADEVLGDIKPLWEPADVLFPIPEREIANNSNLLPQNPGY